MCEKDKIPLVLFSGGFDSTYLLYDALLKHKKVDVICGSMTYHEHANKREKKAMDAIIIELERLRKESELDLGRIGYRGEVEISGTQRGLLRLGQSAAWAASALAHTGSINSEVQIGYVAGDSQLYSFHHIQDAWLSMLKGSLVDNENIIHLTAPMAFWLKGDILMSYPPTLLPLVTWCENRLTEEDDCGKCSSCQRMTKEIVGHFAFDKKGFKVHPIYPRIKKMIRKYKQAYSPDNVIEVKDAT